MNEETDICKREQDPFNSDMMLAIIRNVSVSMSQMLRAIRMLAEECDAVRGKIPD